MIIEKCRNAVYLFSRLYNKNMAVVRKNSVAFSLTSIGNELFELGIETWHGHGSQKYLQSIRKYCLCVNSYKHGRRCGNFGVYPTNLTQAKSVLK